MKEHSLGSVTEEQRRYGQKDQDLVYSQFRGNGTQLPAAPASRPQCFGDDRFPSLTRGHPSYFLLHRKQSAGIPRQQGNMPLFGRLHRNSKIPTPFHAK